MDMSEFKKGARFKQREDATGFDLIEHWNLYWNGRDGKSGTDGTFFVIGEVDENFVYYSSRPTDEYGPMIQKEYIQIVELEPKFKLGDTICWVNSGTTHWQNAKITKVDIKNNQYNVVDAFDGSGAFCFHWDLELVKAAETEIELDSLWIHNKFGLIVKVLLIGVDGRIALVAQNTVEGEATEGEMFIYTQHYQPFTEAYKPYVPEQKTVKLEKWVCVEQHIPTGKVEFEERFYDYKEQARNEWFDALGSYKLQIRRLIASFRVSSFEL